MGLGDHFECYISKSKENGREQKRTEENRTEENGREQKRTEENRRYFPFSEKSFRNRNGGFPFSE
jgi:hypothetical protein